MLKDDIQSRLDRQKIFITEAYANGLVPPSKIRQVPKELIEKHCRFKDIFYTSGRENETYFYDKNEVLATFGIINNPNLLNQNAVNDLLQWKQVQKQNPMGVIYQNCTIQWLEWSDTWAYHRGFSPASHKHIRTGCSVRVKGKTCYITLPKDTNFPNGEQMRKLIGTNGFGFENDQYCLNPSHREITQK
jgi:hypothetical protein